MSTGFPFSIATILEQCGGNKMIAVAILDEFLNQAPTDTAEMETKLAAGDLSTAAKAAHRLKGTAGVMGAQPLHPLCNEVEQACKGGDADKANASFIQLKAEAQRCVDAVPAAMQQLQ